MKKIITLATAVLLVSGAAFAHEGKKCSKGKDCCKKEAAKKEASKKADETKAANTATLKKA